MDADCMVPFSFLYSSNKLLICIHALFEWGFVGSEHWCVKAIARGSTGGDVRRYHLHPGFATEFLTEAILSRSSRESRYSLFVQVRGKPALKPDTHSGH